jgi:Flp pilus assembly protein TadG
MLPNKDPLPGTTIELSPVPLQFPVTSNKCKIPIEVFPHECVKGVARLETSPEAGGIEAMYLQAKKTARRGTIVPLFAVLLIPILAMLCFSIDAGWMVLTRTDLQSTADAAALAGAEQLQELYVQYNLPNNINQGNVLATATGNTPGSPMAMAEKIAKLNKAGNVYINLLDQDVHFGFLDAAGNYTSPYAGFPNTIEVTVRRDGTANTPLQLFFGGILGVPTANLQATARATIYAGTVSSLKSIPGVGAHILPVALDYKVWDNFYATGVSPDGAIHLNASNAGPELKVYPYPGNAPGNFGLLDVGPPANNVPAFRNWIDNGETPNDINFLLDNNLLPVSLSAPKSWKCGPGLKSTLTSDFNSQMWQPNLIPLFKAVQYPSAANGNTYVAASGNGQNATYAIVGFVGVDISNATGSGNNMNISIQPCAVIDPSEVIMNTLPAGTQRDPLTPSVPTPTTYTTFSSAKLTY